MTRLVTCSGGGDSPVASASVGWSRRSVLAASGAACTWGLISGMPTLARTSQDRPPNLVYIICDQLRADIVTPPQLFGIRAPHMNALARGSVNFAHAYTTQPVCTPARGSLMTGLWPHQTGIRQLNQTLREDARILPEFLKPGNYRTAYIGRWHLGDEVFPRSEFHEWTSIHDEYARHYRPYRQPTRRSDYHDWLVSQGRTPDQADGTFSRFALTQLPYAQSRASFVAERSIEFLKRQVTKKQPFALVASFFEPHTPFRGPFDGLYNPREMPLAPDRGMVRRGGEPLRYRLKRARYDNYRAADWQREAAGYAGLVHGVDLAIGRVVDTLERFGLAENTIIVLTSDHGEQLGQNGLMGKSVMYEPSVRVPLVIRTPWHAPRIVDQPVSQIDLLPTVLELMRVPLRPQDDLPGTSLAGAMVGSAPQRPVFIEWNPDEPQAMENQTPYLLSSEGFDDVRRARRESTRTMIDGDLMKLALSDLDGSQMFDLKRDPFELTNLIDDPGYQDRRKAMTEQIIAWQRLTEDTVRIAPEVPTPNEGPDYWSV